MINLHTQSPYFKHTPNEQLNPAIKANLIALYTIQSKKHEFNDSIMVFKTANTYTNLEQFVEKNTEDINTERYEWDTEKETSIDNCEQDIDIIIKTAQSETEETPIYFVQGFFLTEDHAYIISAGTDKKETQEQLYRDFKNIACK